MKHKITGSVELTRTPIKYHIELEQRDSYFNVYCENCHLRHEELKASDGAVNIEDQTITFICHQKACSAKMTVPLKPQIIN